MKISKFNKDLKKGFLKGIKQRGFTYRIVTTHEDIVSYGFVTNFYDVDFFINKIMDTVDTFDTKKELLIREFPTVYKEAANKIYFRLGQQRGI